MEQYLIHEAMDRIRTMERCFDALQKAADNNPASIREDASLKSLLQRLAEYYESGQWLRDYELDEQGFLPPNMKRGILAQDAVYDFLDSLKDAD